ncbi:MAG: glycosyltransferase family 4 protein [Acidobacteriota bacterium]
MGGQPPSGTDKRLALVVRRFPKLSETFVVRQAQGLLERGWDVHVITADAGGDWGAFPDLDRRVWGRRIRREPPSGSRLLAALRLPLRLARCVFRRPRGTWQFLRRAAPAGGARAVKRLYLESPLLLLDPDLVHFEFGSLAVERADLGRLLGCKVVVSFRGFDLNHVGLDRDGFYDPVWRGADALHFLGRDLRDRARRRGFADAQPFALIPPALDPGCFAPRPSGSSDPGPGGPLRILSVGRLDWKKGYEYALRALRRLKDSGVDFEYLILGGGEELDAVAFARHQLGLSDAVDLAGAVGQETVRQRMAEADVFLHLAVSEGFCNAVLEAQAMALPVVASDAGGLPENVVDGETGFIVPRRDPDAAARRLAELAEDPELRQRLGRAGRRRVEEHFRLDQQIAGFEELYRLALSTGEAA